jgi:energy-coupling factor transport system substrate-specific component
MRERATWRIGRRELLAMLVGSVLYGGLSWLTNIFPLGAADLQIRPGVAVPIVFGFVFGPVVGFVTGALGNFMGDLVSGLLPYYAVEPMGNALVDGLRSYLVNWQIGNGLMGLIPGLAALFHRRYFTLKEQLRALVFVVLGVVIGIGFAAFTHVYVDLTVDLSAALQFFFIPVVRVNLINAVILVPILLFNYERFDLRSTEWVRSVLMRRLSIAILISAALPVGLLGLFLTQQARGATASPSELTFKLLFTVVITLLFTIANAGLLAQSMSRPLLRLTRAAQSVEAGELTRTQAGELKGTGGSDEISRLSQVFGRMAQEVILREEKLRQEVELLRIEIDQTKRDRHVAEITESDYFQQLQKKAKDIRKKTK